MAAVFAVTLVRGRRLHAADAARELADGAQEFSVEAGGNGSGLDLASDVGSQSLRLPVRTARVAAAEAGRDPIALTRPLLREHAGQL